MPRSSSRKTRAARRASEEKENTINNANNNTAQDDVNPAADDDNATRTSARTTRSRNKVPVMEQSGQTDAQRRELRRSYRNLTKKMKIDDKDAMEDVTSTKFKENLNRNNQLWEEVRYTREAVLDSENLNLIATSAARQVDKLIEVPRYDAQKFCSKLKKKLTSERDGQTFDWKKLGQEVGVCFNTLPDNVVFLSGPLNAVPKPKKERKKRVVVESEDEEETEAKQKPREVTEQTQDGNKLSAVERNIKQVHQVLQKYTKESIKRSLEKGEVEDDEPDPKKARIGDISAIQYLSNPKSFTQTVENLFHFSFLIKQGLAGIAVTKDKGPVVRRIQPETIEEMPPVKQAIISLNMKDWRKLNAAFIQEGEKGFIPNRRVQK